MKYAFLLLFVLVFAGCIPQQTIQPVVQPQQPVCDHDSCRVQPQTIIVAPRPQPRPIIELHIDEDHHDHHR